jgi:N-acetylglucosamine malate deacetylase 1
MAILCALSQSTMKQVDILAIGAHPDDVELSASGTLLAHAAQGYTFGILDLTQGELGSRGTPELRAQEAAQAAVILGAAFRHSLHLPDGFVPPSANTNTLAIISAIRQCRPAIILANAPSDRHPDHGRAASLVAECAFLSGLIKIETTNSATGEPQQAWRPKAVYHYIQDRQLTPDFVVDITPHFELKMQGILAFKSQFYDPNSTEPSTPISSKDFLDFMEAKARVFGRDAGYTFAEGFIKSRVLGVRNLMGLD